jgi:RNA binding exosome subunit
MKEIMTHLKPRRRKLFREKETLGVKSNIPTLSKISVIKEQADRIEETLTAFHRRVKSKKKQELCDLFAENINLFCRLNKQKSMYEQLFSKNKENREVKRKLKRCTSAHVNRTKTFEDEPP